MFKDIRVTRVLEIGNYAAGYAGKLFSHAKCDVVRVEPASPKPSWVSHRAMDVFLHFDKRRVTTSNLDLIADLAAAADVVVVDGETADEIKSWGFDRWPTPIKVAITPFGLTGPDCNRPATNATILALGGYSNLMGDPGREPLTLPGHYVDFQSGGYAYTAASACLHAKIQDTIDIGMLEVIMSLSQFTTVMWTCAQTVRSRHGNDFWSVVPTNLFRCADGWVYINIVPGFWDAFTTLLDLPELTLDERFKSNALRMANRDDLHEIIGAVFIDWTRSEIQQRATEARVPIGAALSFSEVLDDPHLAERHMWQEVEYGDGDSVRSPRPPYIMRDISRESVQLTDPVHPTDG
ncbi:MAG: hypothetical protein F4W90_04200 [Gammaproteobacteria bacterium]|nr:hypothetical protein [Gammaproteobacteria bacterium]